MVRPSGVPYYVRELIPGRAEGTGVAGESPGVWTGRGSDVLGIRGVVGQDEFSAVFAGRDPVGDRALRVERGPRAVAGVDLVFAAPKSVSLLHLLGPREIAEAAGAAHESAVAGAVGELERAGLGVRRTRGGVTHHLPAAGAVAAGFVHRTSRALDPHVHTHLVVANVGQGLDGLWSSVDTRRLFLHRRCIESVYGASLRRELTDRLGVAWERGRSGRWDIVGVDPVLGRLFSQRTASIDEHVHRAAGGRGSPGLRRVAFHADRPAKDTGPTVDGLRSAWRRRAADHDLDPADLVRVVGRARAAPGSVAIDPDDLAGRLGVEAGRRTTLGTRDLVAAVADASPAGLDPVGLRAAVDALERSVPPMRGTGPSVTTGAAGAVSPDREVRWATEDVLRTLARRPETLAAVLADPSLRARGPVAERTPPVPVRGRDVAPDLAAGFGAERGPVLGSRSGGRDR